MDSSGALSRLVYWSAPIADRPSQNIAQYFEPVAAFLDSALAVPGARVLVHCHAGVSRSVTLVIAYLVLATGMSLDEAYAHVRKRRPVAKPNVGFARQLAEYFGDPAHPAAAAGSTATATAPPDLARTDLASTDLAAQAPTI
ncbi:protein-tyrosine phosphatase-like protein, partial [Entophlyctis helioformis]